MVLAKSFMGVAIVAALAAPFASHAQDNTVTGVSRVVLGSGLPVAASGQELSFRRVTFAPKANIPGEVHSGMQVIYVLSGRLDFQVLGGVAIVRRAQPDGTIGPPIEVHAGPSPVVLGPGDTAVEAETLVLHPSNPFNEPVVILTASLLPYGKTQSVQITEPVHIP
jgi:hypothetical protein